MEAATDSELTFTEWVQGDDRMILISRKTRLGKFFPFFILTTDFFNLLIVRVNCSMSTVDYIPRTPLDYGSL